MIHQVQPHDKWPSGDRVHLAALPFSPEALSARYQLAFIDACDDLGSYKLAAIEFPEIGQVWLEYREDDPPAETLVLVDSNADYRAALNQLLQALGLKENELTWISPLYFLGRGTVGESELIRAVAHEVDQPEGQVAGVVKALFETIESALAQGETVSVPGFGTFQVSQRAQPNSRMRSIGKRKSKQIKRYPSFRPSRQSRVAI